MAIDRGERAKKALARMDEAKRRKERRTKGYRIIYTALHMYKYIHTTQQQHNTDTTQLNSAPTQRIATQRNTTQQPLHYTTLPHNTTTTQYNTTTTQHNTTQHTTHHNNNTTTTQHNTQHITTTTQQQHNNNTNNQIQ